MLRALILLHRWLGMLCAGLFLVWFASGIVMVYARMPGITPEDRLARAEALELRAVAVTPHEAGARAGLAFVNAVQIGMHLGRPIYRLPGAPRTIVYADSGEMLPPLGEAEALQVARRFRPEHTGGARVEALLEQADQWTLQLRQHLPMYRIALDDADDTRLYVARAGGEVVMQTTRRARLLAYLGPVPHWLYFPPLRRNGPLWSRVIVWGSGLGCLLCVAGLTLGLLRLSRAGSPYDGLLAWHHLLGLAFGAVTLTWTFSGLLSMGPWRGLSSAPLQPAQRRAITGETPPLQAIGLPELRAAAAVAAGRPGLREMTLLPFRGRFYWLCDDSRGASTLVSALRPAEGAFARFSNAEVEAAARDAMPGVPLEEAVWLARYDSYYYDSRGARPLPVLRARFADARATALYLDPRRGSVALVSDGAGRLNRWLYHGLHSLDFPRLRSRRPLWDAVVIGLSLGGLALAATPLLPGWRRFVAGIRARLP
jgi:hypothetical protein